MSAVSEEERRHAGPWTAAFRNGPGAGRDRVFSVGPIWQTIVLAPFPEPHGWQIVAGDGIPKDDAEPWGGQATYRLLEIKAGAGENGEPVADYGLVVPSFPPDRPDDSQRYWGD